MRHSSWLASFRTRPRALGRKRPAPAPRHRPRLEALEDRTLLSPALVADINQQPADANVHNLADLNGVLYFAANDGTHGNQLWKSDGTPDGTVMLTDVNPGPGGQVGLNPGALTAVGNNLFFSGNDGTHGYELWESDGTAGGTHMVADLNPGAGSSYPGWLTDVNGTLFFTASNGQTSRLYKSDGTAAGTVAVAGAYPNRIGNLTPAGDGSLYFSTNDPSSFDFYSSILWRTDGTTVQRLTSTREPTHLTAVNGDLFYTDNQIYLGSHLYRTGPGGTVALGSFQVTAAANFDGAFYFLERGTRGLWKSDGTAAGTVRLATFSQAVGGELLPVGGTLYFTANDGTGEALWASDGTAAGTQRLSAAGAGPTDPLNLTAVGDEVYFRDYDSVHGSSLWKSDGTTAGTVRVADVLPPQPNWNISQLTGSGGTLYFVADKAVYDPFSPPDNLRHNRQLWESDGTADGTALVTAINPITLSSSPHALFNLDGTLYFVADDGVHGNQLYRTDGTADGTVALTAVSGGTNAHDFVDLNGVLYFSANVKPGGPEELWQSDGTPGGTAPINGVPGGQALTVYNGAIYYRSFQFGEGYQLWRSDGTAAGTVRLTSYNTGSFFGFDPINFAVVNDTLYFSATDGVNGYQLWESDGTADGTVRVTTVKSLGGIYPGALTDFNGTLVFTALVNNNVQLWKSDGTTAGTVPVATVYQANDMPRIGGLIDVGGTLFFYVWSNTGYRLWKSDGTASGTALVAVVPAIYQTVNYNDTLYFSALDPTHGYQLWTSDGTAAGTVPVTNVNPTRGGLGVGGLTALDGMLVFSGSDGVHGNELWVSDGTAPGTHMVSDINPGPQGSNPANFTDAGGVVYFTADDGAHGVELWKADSHATQLQVLAPATVLAGQPFDVTVQAVNDFGMLDTSFADTITFAGVHGRSGLPRDYTFTADDAGSHTFGGVRFHKVGDQTLTVSDLDNADLVGTATITVQPDDGDGAGGAFAVDVHGSAVSGYRGGALVRSFVGTSGPGGGAFTAGGDDTQTLPAPDGGSASLVATDADAPAFGWQGPRPRRLS